MSYMNYLPAQNYSVLSTAINDKNIKKISHNSREMNIRQRSKQSERKHICNSLGAFQ